MLINLRKFLLSDDVILNITDALTISDEKFLEKTKLNKTINFNGEFFKVEKNLLLNASITYTYLETCARCLEEFDNTITTSFKGTIVESLSGDNTSEDIEIVIRDGFIDLEDTIKQVVYLSMPMKALCSENCKGICPTCGANLNTEKCECDNVVIDPRLEKLKNLLKD